MELNYIANWDKNYKLTWSGTTYSLLSALQTNQSVHTININTSFNKMILKISPFFHSDFLQNFVQERSKKIILKQTSGRAINIQVHSIVDLSYSYIYEDLIWESLLWIKENDPKSFKFSGFQDIDSERFSYNLNNQRKLIGENNVILSMSHWLTNFINDKTIHKAVYVGGGINTSSNSTPVSQRDPQTFLFVGRDFYRKGGDLVVSAFIRVKKIYPKAKLIIAGPTNISNEIKSINGVQFIGNVSIEKISQLMNKATCFVMPSRFEAYGLVFIEAMSNGMPIIGRDKYEMPFFVSKGTGVIMKSQKNDELEITNLTECMVHVLKNRSKYLKKALELVPRIVEEYSWSSVANRIVNNITNTDILSGGTDNESFPMYHF